MTFPNLILVVQKISRSQIATDWSHTKIKLKHAIIVEADFINGFIEQAKLGHLATAKGIKLTYSGNRP